uniref:Putative secreted protein n=1 Tax=Amblyomma triste TaxID=251400 RepID=A0A023G0D7_AMBTT
MVTIRIAISVLAACCLADLVLVRGWKNPKYAGHGGLRLTPPETLTKKPSLGRPSIPHPFGVMQKPHSAGYPFPRPEKPSHGFRPGSPAYRPRPRPRSANE